ncbi:MAG TPA: hypothetical protein VG453_05945 [Nitrospira sp.]|jgi:hypothetical protein|nr:hypothetical protein [Nitrospira sp.]
MKRLAVVLTLMGLATEPVGAVDPPCNAYPPAKQARCAEIWKDLNNEDGPVIAQFGLSQLKRREQGQITAQQHLAENMAFIRQSAEKRLTRLNERMGKE